MNQETKRFLQVQLVWIGISLAISVIVSILLPFPYDLLAMIGAFIGLSYIIRQRQMKKIRSMGGPAGFSSMFGQRTVSYYCMSCGAKHNESRCPNCGSNMRKAEF